MADRTLVGLVGLLAVLPLLGVASCSDSSTDTMLGAPANGDAGSVGDGHAATDGQSDSTPNAATPCSIEGQSRPANSADPTNECRVCNPAISTTSWSFAPEGQACSGGTCESGMCFRGKTYFAAPTGSNARTCDEAQNSATPKADPMAGAACLKSGDKLRLNGIFTGATAHIYETTVNVPDGTAENPTIIEGGGGAGCALSHTCTAVLRGQSTQGTNLESASYIVFRQIEIDNDALGGNDNGFRVGGISHHILLEDVEIHHTADSGIFATGPSSFLTVRRANVHHAGLNGATVNPGHGFYIGAKDVLIEDSSFHDNGNGTAHNNLGGQCYASSAENGVLEGMKADRCIVRRSKFFNNDGDGVVFDGADIQAYDNVLYGNLRAGIAVGYPAAEGGATNSRIFNNTFYGNGSGIQCGLFGGIANQSCNISNNLIAGNGATIEFFTGWTNSGTPASNRTTGAITDCTVSTIDFHLKPGVPCIDAGIDIPLVTTDIEGVPRKPGSYDIGAYERP